MKKAVLFGRMLLILPFLFLNYGKINAQITETALRGNVSDSAGNSVVASAVVAQNDATAQLSTTTTNENGEFVFRRCLREAIRFSCVCRVLKLTS